MNKYLRALRAKNKDKFDISYLKPTFDPRDVIQKNKYGFADRETCDLDTSFFFWLYSRCNRYLELTEGKVKFEQNTIGFEGKIYNQKEAIEFIIEGCEKILTENPVYWREEEEFVELRRRVTEMWMEILSYMWW